MDNDIYLQFGIDSSKLKRDYIKNPVKVIYGKRNSDKPYKEDLKYLYIKMNLSYQSLISYFNVSQSTITKWLKYYNIKKDKKLESINREKSVLKKYGVKNAHQSNLIKEKIKQTCLEKYGVENPAQLKEVQEKQKQTNLNKYGVEYPAQLKEVQEKRKQTNLEKYGVEYPAQLKEIIGKAYNTKKKNHTFGKSKEEDEIYNLLCSKYKEVKRQYKENRYPFACDFYVPELDLFIEYQGYFTHGKEPYTGTKKQKETIKLWESKNTTKYNDAINTWVKRDPLKRETAKKNHLKYLEFFNKKDFMNWYNVINNNI